MTNPLSVKTSLQHSLFHPVVAPDLCVYSAPVVARASKLRTRMGGSIQETISQADELYSKRQRRENVRASVDILRHVTDGTGNFDIDWRLGRAFFFLGQEAAGRDLSHSYHLQGIEVSERAVGVKPGSVEGHFWLGVNLALCARLGSPIAAIRHALRAKRVLEGAVRINSAYHAAGPLRALGRMEHKLPFWLGGSRSCAQASYEEAIAIAPENTVTRVYFAELLLELGEQNQARSQLKSILNGPHDPQWAFEIERDRRIAKEMLTRIQS